MLDLNLRGKDRLDTGQEKGVRMGCYFLLVGKVLLGVRIWGPEYLNCRHIGDERTRVRSLAAGKKA
jgi:hypothetical protein